MIDFFNLDRERIMTLEAELGEAQSTIRKMAELENQRRINYLADKVTDMVLNHLGEELNIRLDPEEKKLLRVLIVRDFVNVFESLDFVERFRDIKISGGD